MADVWRAEVSGAEGVVKEVALKLVRGEHAARSDFVRMFVQEARLAARLTHANVVQVFEFDQIDGRYYLAMELVRGRHLGQVAERARELGARFGLPRAVHVGAEVAKGLAYAHRLADGGRLLGLVHRDVSPHNVLVSFEGEVKLADFGIARAMNSGELTDPGTVKGKLAYMAPEQARGATVDARADVFSLGVVLWELCAGRRLFARESDAATLAAVLAAEPVSRPSAWNEEIPAELDAAILGALERDPERRTRSAQELAAALAAVLLRVTRAPEDVDLRAFVQRLFPREAALAASGAPAQEATAVRPVPVAREPQAEPSIAEASPAPSEEGATRTAPSGLRRAPRRLAAPAAVAVGAAAAAALAVLAAPWRHAREAPDSAPGSPPPATAVRAATAAPRASPPAIPSAAPNAMAPTTTTPTPKATPTPTPTPIPSATSTPTPAAQGAAPARRSPPLKAIHALEQLPMPPAASGEGILSVNPMPWGAVTVDGEALGDSPLEVQLPAGRHRVRIDRRGQRGPERPVTVEAGRRILFPHPPRRAR
jgi:serine/threonine-protein kinase